MNALADGSPTLAPAEALAETTGAPIDGGQPPKAGALGRGAIVGRYVVISKLGAGGMGVVYAAYDPELDRRVAVKLLRPDANGSMGNSEGRTRLLREAQALAKLSHPNVVGVFDAGTVDETVWLAMELVEGITLTQWLAQRPRRWREVVEVLGAAGRGLAAAHAVDLLHRDFKPDNVMVGSDGRVRVMDFGLARTRHKAIVNEVSALETVPKQRMAALAIGVTQAGALLGTPAYMSPEQLCGEQPDARSDQFAFAVSLWEALYGKRPYHGASFIELAAAIINAERRPGPRKVPAWLRRICERGLETKPEQRFATVAELLDAMQRGHARARRRWVLGAAAAVGVAALGFEVHHRVALAEAAEHCRELGAEIELVWNDDAREAVRSGLLATGVGYAATTADKVMPWIDADASAWRAQREQACVVATIEQSWDTETADRSQWCFDERRMELETTVNQLVDADREAVEKAVVEVAGLHTHERCLDEAALARTPAPPPETRTGVRDVRAEIWRVDALRRSGRGADALEAAALALTHAEAVSWPPLVVTARRALASAHGDLGDYRTAAAELERAYFDAEGLASPSDAAATAMALAYVVGHQQARPEDGRLWCRLAEVELDRLGIGTVDLLRATLESANGVIALTAADFDAARRHYQSALEISQELLGDEHPQVAAILNNLSEVERRAGKLAEARDIQERALAIKQRTLGPEHPDVAFSLVNLGGIAHSLHDLPRARALVAEGLAIEERSFDADHPDLATPLNILGNIDAELGDYTTAQRYFERALAIREKQLGPDHPLVASPLIGLAECAFVRGDLDVSIAAAARAVALDEAAKAPAEDLAVTRMQLLKALWARGRDRERAIALARTAARACDEATIRGPGCELVQTWQAEIADLAPLPRAER